MQQGRGLFFGAMILAASVSPATLSSAAQAAEAAAQAGAYVATYIEIPPQSVGAATSMLKSEAAATRKDMGCQSVRVLREIGRANRFVVLETWADQNAYQAHLKAPHVVQFGDQLGPLKAPPPDTRVMGVLWAGPASTSAGRSAVYIVTHVDVPGSFKAQGDELLKDFAEVTSKEDGSLGFKFGAQFNRPNHFTVMEIWKNAHAFEVYQAAASTKAFRDKLTPMLGALYDERIYRAVD
jgi:quinol monooxygenase YgiN